MSFSNRESGPEPNGHDSPGRYTWMGFKRNQFGARESLKNLEPGIALLVKVLPWFGVWTAMSCQGHLRKRNFNRPKLWFNGNFHGQWCKMVFEHLFRSWEFSKQWRFSWDAEGSGWCSAIWEARPPLETKEEHKRCLEDIFFMARVLMLEGLSKRVRAAKAAVVRFEELKEALEREVRISEWMPKMIRLEEEIERERQEFERRFNR